MFCCWAMMQHKWSAVRRQNLQFSLGMATDWFYTNRCSLFVVSEFPSLLRDDVGFLLW